MRGHPELVERDSYCEQCHYRTIHLPPSPTYTSRLQWLLNKHEGPVFAFWLEPQRAAGPSRVSFAPHDGWHFRHFPTVALRWHGVRHLLLACGRQFPVQYKLYALRRWETMVSLHGFQWPVQSTAD